MLTIEYAVCEEDVAEKMNNVTVNKNLKITGVNFVDYESIQGYFYPSGMVAIEVSFEDEYAVEAYMAIEHMYEDLSEIARPTKEEIDEWVKVSMPWSTFSQTSIGKQLLAMDLDAAWDKCDEVEKEFHELEVSDL